MKTRLIAISLLVLFALGILSGCVGAAARQPQETAKPTEAAAVTVNEPAPASAEPKRITAEEAESIALKAAGIAPEDARYLHTEFDYDNGVPEYDIEFHADGVEYEYEIHAETGAILRSKKEAKPAPAATEPPATEPAATETPAAATAPTESQRLSKEEAIAIALKAAGLAENQVIRLKAEFDYDDGIPEYDVEFHHDGWEYEYEIHAESGNILRSDKDWDD